MQLIDITEQLEKEITRTNIKEGSCYLFNPHTTAGLTLNLKGLVQLSRMISSRRPWMAVLRSMER